MTVIDWGRLLQTGLGLVGIALVLAAVSVTLHEANSAMLSRHNTLRKLAANGTARLGILLAGTGLALTASSTIEAFIWLCLGLYAAASWAVTKLRTPQPAPDNPDSNQRPAAASPEPNGNLIQKTAAALSKFEMLWIVLLAPFYLFPNTTPNGPLIWTLPLLCLPLLCLVRRIATGRWLPSTPLDWPLVVLMLAVCLSMIVTFDLSYSVARITTLTWSIGLYYGLVQAASSRLRLGWSTALVALLGTGFALLGVLGISWTWLLGDSFANKLFPALGQLRGEIPPLLRGAFPDTSRWLHPNEVGGALLWVVPLQLALTYYVWSNRPAGAAATWSVRLLALPAAGISLITLLSTQSRGALLGVIAGTALIVVAAFVYSKWIGRAAIVAAMLVGLGALWFAGPVKIATRLTQDSTAFNIFDIERSVSGRLVIWSRAVAAIEDHSLTGIGMDTFRVVMPTLYPTGDARDNNTSHPHNQFLGAALELGLPGLTAYLTIWIIAAFMCAKTLRVTKHAGARAISIGASGALLGYFLYGLTDVVPLGDRPGLLFWALLGLLAATYRLETAPAKLAVYPEQAAMLPGVQRIEELLPAPQYAFASRLIAGSESEISSNSESQPSNHPEAESRIEMPVGAGNTDRQ